MTCLGDAPSSCIPRGSSTEIRPAAGSASSGKTTRTTLRSLLVSSHRTTSVFIVTMSGAMASEGTTCALSSRRCSAAFGCSSDRLAKSACVIRTIASPAASNVPNPGPVHVRLGDWRELLPEFRSDAPQRLAMHFGQAREHAGAHGGKTKINLALVVRRRLASREALLGQPVDEADR